MTTAVQSPPSSSPRRPALPVLGLVSALVLSACSTDGADGPPPSVISPEALVTCEDNGDCGEAGAVRWSVPLEGDHRLFREPEWPSEVVPPELWMDRGLRAPGAVAADGTLYYHGDSRVTARAADTGAELWSEAFDEPVASVGTAGETVVVRTRGPGEEGATVHLLRSAGDGVEHLGTEVPDDLADVWVRGNGTHVAVGEDHEDTRARGPRRVLMLDAATGAVEWSDEVTGSLLNTNLAADNALYLAVPLQDSEDGPSRVARVVDGREDLVFERPEEAGGDSYDLWATDTGEVVFNTGRCERRAIGCDTRGLVAVEADTGRTLWQRKGTGSVVSLTTDGGATLLHVARGGGYRTVDARTGEVVAERTEAAAETEALLPAFTGQRQDPAEALPPELRADDGAVPEEDAARAQEALDMVPTELRGPGMERPVVLDGLAAGTRHLTTYLDADGHVLGAFLGCAPDGVRPPSWDAASPEAECAAPRLFTVDYGL
ncbi:PQQ-binding-like beta-propeller repeat protein [Nocardiopsis sp. NPDC007018]|uniref:PQQ-binding-like beta-propeller repeat protein n=1 Tax=Nocardiopsis sp. NPDC007018 TaxID=3155721 RepID=UPI0033E7285E